MKAVVFTLGCKVNSCESASLMKGLKDLGYEVDDKLSYADVYILNTCAVTQEAEKKSRQAVARARKFNPRAEIFVIGCASQNNPDSFWGREGVKLVMGASAKEKLLTMLGESGKFISEDCGSFNCELPYLKSKARIIVKIQDGCDNFCSYCIIPYLRGRSRSRSVESIISELEYINPLEAVLTGINLSAYNFEGVDLAGLLTRLKGFDFRFRLGSLETRIIDDGFLTACSELKNFAPHFHLSLQSGSTKVLREMNRKYTADEYAKCVEKIREYFPDAAITTDVIVGFSTETERDFEESYDFCKNLCFSDIHCFPYSPRKGTAAFSLKQIPHEDKEARLKKMLALKAALKADYIGRHVGGVLSLVPEELRDGYTTGYTENYIRVYAEGKLPEEIVKVKLTEPFKDGAKAVIYKE